ncbi:putative ORFan [Tupanvirus deep ocean]|uniref:ORFan n=2 Tax=Tupanvirus TaxID=2094720 RepID=A0AC62A904_9VIRU|nr:putative ORFan [Tupanvirus deep ocean]QKU34152.1 putative ORFan [Tupanvirus deep ocean]
MDKQTKPTFSEDFLAFRELQAKKWREMEKQQKLEEKRAARIEAEKLRQEKQILEEKKYKLQMFFVDIDKLISLASNAKNIIKIDVVTADLLERIKSISDLLTETQQKDKTIEKVFAFNGAISENPHATFNVAKGGYEVKAQKNIVKNIKLILVMLDCDPDILDTNVMDTSNDEEFARRLQEQLNF